MALSIKNDLLFKRCFANAEYPGVVANFIADVLKFEVSSIEIENPYSIEEFENAEGRSSMRHTEVDILVRLKDQRLVNVELQRQEQEFYFSRSIYYLASRFTDDYGRKEFQQFAKEDGSEKYSSLHPIFGINIVDFTLFGEDQRLLHSFSFRDNDTFEALKQGMLNLCYIELGKEPPKQLRQWVNFFNGRPIVEDAPEYIKQAYQLVDYANLSDKERKMISAAERKEQDFIGYINFARKEGRAEGRAEVALNLLDADMPMADIATLTGLTEQEIQRLAKACRLQR